MCRLTGAMGALALVLVIASLSPEADAQQDGEADAKLFRKHCQTCHSIEKGGKSRVGPPLWGVFGRVAGTVPDYAYSGALRDADLVWDAQTLDRLLGDSPAFLPGTKMFYRQRDPEIRARLIEFLKSQK